MNDWGIYVHLPYCKSVCPYCDFNSHVQPDPPWQDLQRCLLAELCCHAPAMASGAAQTVYFGGGTPSLAPPEVIETVITGVQRQVGLVATAEITLEANPGTVNQAIFAGFRAAGVNRVSLGWQSTHDRLLRVLGRGHSAQDSHAAYVAARAAGFDNISLDLIFAVPGQSMEDLQADLRQVLALQPEHVSLYALTYKEGTPFYRRRARGTLKPADEDLECAMMEQIDTVLRQAGYEHYEVSNYARVGKRARHNSLYWQGARYLGIGPGAHSFHHEQWRTGRRWESVRDPRRYLQIWGVAKPSGLPTDGGDTCQWAERVNARQLLAERMLCGLRQADGVHLSEEVCAPFAQEVQVAVDQAARHDWAHLREGVLRPTALGLRHADALAALFF